MVVSKAGNLFKRLNDSEGLSKEVEKINSYFRDYLKTSAISPEKLGVRLKANDTRLFRLYQFISEGKGLLYESAREKMFNGIDVRRNFYCLA